MATSKRTGLRYADLPAVDVARFADNPAASRFAEQVRQIIETRFGKAGQEVDRAVTWGDLVESGIVARRAANGNIIRVDNPTGGFLPATPPVIDGVPPAPTGLTVTPGLATVILEWDQPTFSYFGYAEIWRSTTDNLGDAVMVGQTTAWIYPDAIDSSATHYYWVRFISQGGKVGPFNAVGGRPAAASLDPAYLIDVLSADDPNALLYEIPEATVINGVPVPAGLYMRDVYVANGSISNAKIGNAAIDNAKVASLSAAKVTFGEMSGDRISVNSLNADRLIATTLAAKLAQITTAYIGQANLQNAIVDNAKLTGPIYSNNWVYGVSGWLLNTDGNLYANSGEFRGNLMAAGGTFKGALSAATGSFAGTLSAATGSFSGSLTAATGTFSGTLTASAINAVDTLNVKGNAITVPVGYSGYTKTASMNIAVGTATYIAITASAQELSQGYLTGALAGITGVYVNGVNVGSCLSIPVDGYAAGGSPVVLFPSVCSVFYAYIPAGTSSVVITASNSIDGTALISASVLATMR